MHRDNDYIMMVVCMLIIIIFFVIGAINLFDTLNFIFGGYDDYYSL